MIFLEDLRSSQKKYDFCCVSLKKYGYVIHSLQKDVLPLYQSTIIYYDQYKSTVCVLAHAKTHATLKCFTSQVALCSEMNSTNLFKQKLM